MRGGCVHPLVAGLEIDDVWIESCVRTQNDPCINAENKNPLGSAIGTIRFVCILPVLVGYVMRCSTNALYPGTLVRF